MSDNYALTEYVLLTEECTDRDCGRLRYSELTDTQNTHWHVKRGVPLVPTAPFAARVEQDVRRQQREQFQHFLRGAGWDRLAAWAAEDQLDAGSDRKEYTDAAHDRIEVLIKMFDANAARLARGGSDVG